MKIHKADPELLIFFQRLIDIKQFVRDEIDDFDSNDDHLSILNELYEKLDDLIKEEECDEC